MINLINLGSSLISSACMNCNWTSFYGKYFKMCISSITAEVFSVIYRVSHKNVPDFDTQLWSNEYVNVRNLSFFCFSRPAQFMSYFNYLLSWHVELVAVSYFPNLVFLKIGIPKNFCNMISTNTLLSRSFWHFFGPTCAALFSPHDFLPIYVEFFGMLHWQKCIFLYMMHLMIGLSKDLIGFETKELHRIQVSWKIDIV